MSKHGSSRTAARRCFQGSSINRAKDRAATGNLVDDPANVTDLPAAALRHRTAIECLVELHCGGGHGTLAVNEKLRLVPGHCDPTCNLHDMYVGVRGKTVETLWPVSARGKSY